MSAEMHATEPVQPSIEQLMQMLQQQDVALKTVLNNQYGMKIAIAALVLVAGGDVIVTKADIHKVADMQFSRLENADGSFTFSIREKPPAPVEEKTDDVDDVQLSEPEPQAEPFSSDGL
jgi:hypothetical protein